MKEVMIVILTALGTKLVDWLFGRRRDRASVMEAEIANLRTIITTWQENATKWEAQAAEYQRSIIEWQEQAMAYKSELVKATDMIASLKHDIDKLRKSIVKSGIKIEPTC